MNAATEIHVPLKVLCLEDSILDAELMLELLNASGFDLQYDIVTGEAEFTAFLKSKRYDIILSDYNLHGFTGMTALDLANSICPEIPFICISGAISEEIAVEMLKKGAVDYLMKDRIKRLPFAVREALEKKKDKKEKEEAYKATKESEERYRSLFAMAGDGIFIITLDGTLVEVNESFARMHGYTVEELRLMSLKDLDTPETTKLFPERIKRILAGECIRIEVEHFHKDGHIFPLECSATLMQQGGEFFIISFHRDITERKKAEENLRESEAAHKKMIANISDVIAIMDKNGTLKYESPNIEKWFGWLPEDLVGTDGWETVHPDDLERTQKEFFTLLEKDNSQKTSEFKYKCKDGTYKTIELTAVNLTKDPIINGVLMNYRDTTDKKIIEEHEKVILNDLIEAKEKAELSNKLKDAFITTISHEIRTPLNGILGMASLIKEIFEQHITEEEIPLFTGIDISSKRITRTVDMILNHSRLHVGDYPITPSEIDIGVLCENLVGESLSLAKLKSLEFTFENKCPNTKVIADEYSVIQSVSNLIDNAVKFTNKGYVKITLYENNNSEVLFEIQDSGIGMSGEYIEHIFEPYSQEDIGYGRAYDGIGLGLTIVKRLFDLNNFAISVQSTKGEGTTFTCNFGKII